MRRGLVVVASVLWAVSAQAATLRVPEEYGTIQAAMDASVAGDSVLVGPGIWRDVETRTISINGLPTTLCAALFWRDGVSIVGVLGPDHTVILTECDESQSTSVAVRADQPVGAQVSIAGLTLAGANADQILVNNASGGILSIENCVLRDGGLAVLTRGSTTLTDVLFAENGSGTKTACGIDIGLASLKLDRCRVELNEGPFLRFVEGPALEVADCTFANNREGPVLQVLGAARQPDVSIVRNWFGNNFAYDDAIALCLDMQGCRGDVASNVFCRNGPNGKGGPVIATRNFAGTGPSVRRNTFWASNLGEGAAVISRVVGPGALRANVFAGSTGGSATIHGSQAQDGCNLFWDNESPDFFNYTRRPTDIVADPQFCDPDGESFVVAASSPCLPENNFSECGPIGFGPAACQSTGQIPHVVTTQPQGLAVVVDGVVATAPDLAVWTQGTEHTIEVPTPQAGDPGTRFAYLDWSDGGDRAHTVLASTHLVEYSATFSAEHQLQTAAHGSGSAAGDGWFAEGELAEVEAVPALGFAFVGWTGTGSGSYSGGNNPATVTMNEPITQTATFVVGELPLTMLAEEGGAVTPESGDVTSFTDVEIEAIPDPGYRFVQWKGQGDGSYTGTDNPAAVTLSGPITQVAHFEPAAFSATLSLSDTDPYVHTGGPIGLGNVHLWVTCGTTEHGFQSIALKTAGSLHPLAFLPAPGVSASGAGTVLASIDGCPDGPVRLGSFLVNAPGEGSLCLDAAGAVSGLTVTDCRGATYSWPENVGFVGVNTDGGQPCGGGSGCDEIGPFAAPVGAPDVPPAPSMTRLAGIFPSPFSGETTVRFEAARPMEIRISVFDVSGRQVKRLRHGSVPAGRHSVDWDGRDASGTSAAAGIYFVRLQGDGVDETGKVTLLRERP